MVWPPGGSTTCRPRGDTGVALRSDRSRPGGPASVGDSLGGRGKMSPAPTQGRLFPCTLCTSSILGWVWAGGAPWTGAWKGPRLCGLCQPAPPHSPVPGPVGPLLSWRSGQCPVSGFKDGHPQGAFCVHPRCVCAGPNADEPAGMGDSRLPSSSAVREWTRDWPAASRTSYLSALPPAEQ